MSQFNFNNTNQPTETTGFVNQRISYGVNLLTFNAIEFKTSSTGKLLMNCHVEGPALGAGFEGADRPDGSKAQGLVGKVDLGIYFDPEDQVQVNNAMNNLMFIATKMGVEQQVRDIKASSIEELIEKYIAIVQGKFAWFVLKGKEYLYNDKVYVGLSFKESKIGKNAEGNDVYQVFCKHIDFKDTDVEPVRDDKDVIIKLKGHNVVGSSIGKSDTLIFDVQYDYKSIEPSDSEDSDLGSNPGSELGNAF